MTQGYNPLHYVPAQPGNKTASGLGIASLVIGIIAVLFSWVPLCGMAAIPIAVIGLVLGIVGFIVAVSGQRTGKAFPIAGSVVCLLAIGIQVVVTGGLMFLGSRVQPVASPVVPASTTQPTGGGAAANDPGYTISNDPPGDDVDIVLASEVKKATAMKRKPFVEFYASWCPPCRAVAKYLDANDPQMADAFAGTYVIRLDADVWSNQLAGSGMKANQIPIFYELDDAGKITGRHILSDAWGDDVPANMAPVLKKFFQGGREQP